MCFVLTLLFGDACKHLKHCVNTINDLEMNVWTNIFVVQTMKKAHSYHLSTPLVRQATSNNCGSACVLFGYRFVP